MKGLVLAAGRGMRLRPLTLHTPKSLVTIAGKPLLEHILAGLRSVGISEIMVVIGWLGEQIERHFGNGSRFGLSLSYARQDEPTGSADAVLLAQDFAAGSHFLLTWGDILTDQRNYSAVLSKFREKLCNAVLGVNWVEDPAAGAAVYVEGDRVVNLIEKPPAGTSTTHWNNAGVMILPSDIFPDLRTLPLSARGEHELPQVFPRLIEAGRILLAAEFQGLWSDVGTPQEVERLNWTG